MKIAIIGATGFVGSNLVNHLSKKYTVVPVTSQTHNLLDSKYAEQFLEKERFDVIVNAAARMSDPALINDTRNNLGLFMNLHSHRHLFHKLINLGSGAEFDRTTNINLAHEDTIKYCMPTDSYGFGQNIKSRISRNTDNFYTLRIFNCFGPGEMNTRIFPKLLSCTDVFRITEDRYFDYFYIEDLCTVVEKFCLTDYIHFPDVNCVYPNKIKISEALQLFAKIKNINTPIEVVSTSNNNYTGSGSNLSKLKFNLLGLEEGFQRYD